MKLASVVLAVRDWIGQRRGQRGGWDATILTRLRLCGAEFFFFFWLPFFCRLLCVGSVLSWAWPTDAGQLRSASFALTCGKSRIVEANLVSLRGGRTHEGSWWAVKVLTLQPCDLWEVMRDRTIWILGDSVTEVGLVTQIVSSIYMYGACVLESHNHL